MTEAERLAEKLETEATIEDMGRPETANAKRKAAAELRRLSAINAELVEALEICKAEAGVPETVWKTSKKALEKAKQ